MEHPGTEPLIAAALRDPNAQLRANTVLICSRHRYATCVPILLAMGDDPDPLVRRYLGAALGLCGDKKAVDVLLKLLQETDPDPFISIWAAHGLGEWKRPEAVTAMVSLLRSGKARDAEGNILDTLHTLTGETFHTRQACLAWWEKSGRAKHD
jgi:HEAT repeat protein